MSKGLRIRRGARINLKGKAEKIINESVGSRTYALQPDDFFALTPKMHLKEGAKVQAGTPVFFSKNNPRIQFVSPVAGTLKAIVRGPKRKILEVVIEAQGDEAVSHTVAQPEKMDREAIVEVLLQSGSWPFLRQRPYNVIADPEVHPKAIYISAFATAPLDADFEFLLKDQLASFQKGIDVLHQLAETIYLATDQNYQSALAAIKHTTHIPVSGPHPAGNESVIIHHTDPLAMHEKVWTIRPEDVVNIGLLFETGQYSAQRTVAVAGSAVGKPHYIKTKIGAQLSTLCEIAEVDTQLNLRYINGDVLTGRRTQQQGHLGFYNNLLSIILEGNQYRMFGWMPFKDNGIPSLSKTSFAWLSNKAKAIDTNLNGEERALVVTGEMEKVFPMDIYPMQLLKACMIGDIEKMEWLGIYEVIPEDFGLIDFANTSKIEAQEIIKDAMYLMLKEVG
jgi:Na+-transporting NADH:ubiquinone oxidoreductase subunit A